MNSNRFARLGLLLAALCGALASAKERKPSLQIDSPADGTVVNPGQTITVSVSSPSGVSFKAVAVLAENPLGITELANSVPTRFSIAIPSNISCRRYMLTAHGVTTTGQSVDSKSLGLDVERPDTPVSIESSQFPSLTLEAKDPPFHLIILATFSDRSEIDVTESSYLTYQSSNTDVATVEGYAGIKAVGPGTASITVTYKKPNRGERATLSARNRIIKETQLDCGEVPSLRLAGVTSPLHSQFGSECNRLITSTMPSELVLMR